jgi:hypothetical protein
MISTGAAWMREHNLFRGQQRVVGIILLLAACGFTQRRSVDGLALPALPSVTASQVSHCSDAARFLGDDRKMVAITESDTLDDWRTGKRQSGCRVTAAGLTENPIAQEAVRFYEHVRRAGWTRTPDPRDSPGEASLRFRKRDSDCLFNVYESALLMTEAERKVSIATTPSTGVSRYYVFVFCMSAQPAAPRGRG